MSSPRTSNKWPGEPEPADVDGYVKLRKIGEGSFAIVYEAIHESTGQRVAMKIVNKKRLPAGYPVEKLYREISVMKLLHHPNIIKLLETFEDDFYVYLLLEFAKGGNLLDYIVEHGTVHETLAWSIMRQMVSALQYCHYHCVVHRDLKAENLLFDGNMNLKIADFGFSTNFLPYDLLSTPCGTPSHAAPELFRGEPYVGPEVDVWSAGIILYTMSTGFLPFQGDTLMKLKSSILQDIIIPPEELIPDIDMSLAGLIMSMLERDPAQRITINKMMLHPWMTKNGQRQLLPYVNVKSVGLLPNPQLHKSVLKDMKSMGISAKEVEETLQNKRYNLIFATYQLLEAYYIQNGMSAASPSQINSLEETRKMRHMQLMAAGPMTHLCSAGALSKAESSTSIKSRSSNDSDSASSFQAVDDCPASPGKSKGSGLNRRALAHRALRQTASAASNATPASDTGLRIKPTISASPTITTTSPPPPAAMTSTVSKGNFRSSRINVQNHRSFKIKHKRTPSGNSLGKASGKKPLSDVEVSSSEHNDIGYDETGARKGTPTPTGDSSARKSLHRKLSQWLTLRGSSSTGSSPTPSATNANDSKDRQISDRESVTSTPPPQSQSAPPTNNEPQSPSQVRVGFFKRLITGSSETAAVDSVEDHNGEERTRALSPFTRSQSLRSPSSPRANKGSFRQRLSKQPNPITPKPSQMWKRATSSNTDYGDDMDLDFDFASHEDELENIFGLTPQRLHSANSADTAGRDGNDESKSVSPAPRVAMVDAERTTDLAVFEEKLEIVMKRLESTSVPVERTSTSLPFVFKLTPPDAVDPVFVEICRLKKPENGDEHEAYCLVLEPPTRQSSSTTSSSEYFTSLVQSMRSMPIPSLEAL